ncbi:unnamed protein product, partial [Mesorhabditis spiculigera]
MRLLILFLAIPSAMGLLEQLAMFKKWDILTHTAGEALFTQPASQKCFGYGLNFDSDHDSSSTITYKGIQGSNITASVLASLKNYCERIAPHYVKGYEELPMILKDLDDINVGDDHLVLKIPVKSESELDDYDYELTKETATRVIDLRNVFTDLDNGHYENLLTTPTLQDIITNFIANHVSDVAVKHVPLEYALAKVATVRPAKCDAKKKSISVLICFPMLDFFQDGHVVEVVHRGQFIEVENETIYAQVGLPSHVFVPSSLTSPILPIDVAQCTRPSRSDFICPTTALLPKNECLPPSLKNCPVILADSRMPPKVRVFGDGYVVKSFHTQIEQQCDGNTTSMEYTFPINLWFRPLNHCFFMIGEAIEFLSLPGSDSFETILENLMEFRLSSEVLDGYFYERLPGVQETDSHFENVWRHQRKALFVSDVIGNKLVVSERGHDQNLISETRTAESKLSRESPQSATQPISQNALIIMVALSLLLSIISTFIALYFSCNHPRHQKLAVHA